MTQEADSISADNADVLTALVECPPVDGYGGPKARQAVEGSLRRCLTLARQWGDIDTDFVYALKTACADFVQCPESEPGLKPKRGHITDYPLFAALWAQPAPGYATVGRAAQTSVLYSAWKLRRSGAGLDLYAASLQAACRSVRQVLAGILPPAEMQSLSAAVSMRALVELLNDWLEQLNPEDERLKEERRTLRGWRAICLDALKTRPPRHHRAAGHSVRSRRGGNQTRELDDPTPAYTALEEIRAASPEVLKEAGAPMIEAHGRRLMLLEPDEGTGTGLSKGQMFHRAKFRSRAIATSAQGLLVSARHLQLVDVAALMEAAADLLSGHWKPRPKVGRAAAAVYLSLLTGRSIQHLNKFRVFATPAEADPAGAQDVELIVDTRQFRIRIPELPNAYVPAAEEAYLYRATTRTLNLKLPVLPCTSLILRVLKSIAQVPFGKRNPTLVKQAEDFVRMVNHRAGARITLARVAQFLARQIHLMSGDWADASLVSGEERSDPRLYYYAPSVVTLQNHYDAVWRGVQAGLRPPDSESSSAPVSNGANASRGPSVSVGSRGCPRDDAVREMVESQIESCQAALRGRRGSKRIRTAHNALAIYTYLMVAWHTGVRAVDVPVDLVQYDSATGFLGVSDKDTDDYYASRLAWLPPVAQKQVARYLSNVDTLSADAGLELAHGLGLFLLDDAGKPVQFTMKVLRRLLVDYPFRLNAQRHYLRTRLRELHVPAQAVDALLGHGDPGQESYARHSCYSPEQMKREMGSALKKLSIQMGWRVLPAC